MKANWLDQIMQMQMSGPLTLCIGPEIAFLLDTVQYFIISNKVPNKIVVDGGLFLCPCHEMEEGI